MGQAQSKTFEIQNDELASQMPIKFDGSFINALKPDYIKEIEKKVEIQQIVDHEREKQTQKRVFGEKRSSEQLLKKSQELLDTLDLLKEGNANKSARVTELQNELIECYRNNPKKSLDCWDELQQFKRAQLEATEKLLDLHK